MIGRRGQGAMEYLMTYGWAILVVMIVGIVMWQLGIFSMGSTTITQTGFSKIKPQLAATGLKADGTFVGVFTNGAGTSITISDVELFNTMHGTATSTGVVVNPTSSIVGAGNNFQVSAAVGQSTVSAGDVYTLDVDIEYSVIIGSVTTTHKDHGTLRGPYEAT